MSARRTARVAITGALGGVLVLAGVMPADADAISREAPRVEMIDLTPFLVDDGVAEARVVNDRGVVAGFVGGEANEQRSFRWHRGTFTELPHLGGSSDAVSINDRGQIAGWSVALPGPSHAVVWEPDGTLVDLAPDGGYSTAVAINRRGTVLGGAGAAGVSARPVVWRDGVLLETAPDALPPFFGADLNDRDVVVVNVRDETTDVTGPVLWDGGEVTPLPAVAGPRGALGLLVNNRNEVAGYERGSDPDVPTTSRGILWDGTDVVELASGGAVSVTDLDDRGVVVGHAGECGQCRQQAFVFRDGQYTALPALRDPEAHSVALAVNRRGQVVGESVTAEGVVHATLWDGGRPIDLGSLGGSSQAVDINRRGQIVGWSEDEGGVRHAVMWIVRP